MSAQWAQWPFSHSDKLEYYMVNLHNFGHIRLIFRLIYKVGKVATEADSSSEFSKCQRKVSFTVGTAQVPTDRRSSQSE